MSHKAIDRRSQLKPMSSRKVTNIDGHDIKEIDSTRTVPVYELATLLPIQNSYGDFPTLEQSLVERSAGLSVDIGLLSSAGLSTSAAKYGALDTLVVPVQLVENNPTIKLHPLKLEYASYLPFIEGGVKFVMVSLIEYGRRADAIAGAEKGGEDGVKLAPISKRYIYHAPANAALHYLPNYSAAVQVLVGGCVSN